MYLVLATRTANQFHIKKSSLPFSQVDCPPTMEVIF